MSVSRWPRLSTLPVVIFDLDGTLVDTLEPTFHCFQEAVAPALGRRPSREEVLARFGPADHRIVAEWVGPQAREAAIARLYACYETAFRRSGPFPGIVELLRDLRARGRRTALFTGRGRPSTDVILRAMNLAHLFDASVTGEEVPLPKPAPDGLLRVLELLGKRAEDAVYVGDTLKDLEAAKGAGMIAVAALWASPERQRLEVAGAVTAGTVEDLRSLLGE